MHDFVPFYFAPRSPMLCAINGGRVAGCDWRQADIVHLESTVTQITPAGVPFVFYDRNATLAFSAAYTDLARLDAIDWDLLTEEPQLDGFCQYWQNKANDARYADRMEKRQAEFLVHRSVPLAHIQRIGVINTAKQVEVAAILGQHGVNLPVELRPSWYF